RFPLERTGRALLGLPLVVEQQVQIAVVPLGGVGGPRAFQAAGHRIVTDAALGVVVPAQALLLHVGRFRLGTQQSGVAVAVALAHGVAANRQRGSFLVVHGHALEGHAHVLGGLERIGVAVHALWIHVDQP